MVHGPYNIKLNYPPFVGPEISLRCLKYLARIPNPGLWSTPSICNIIFNNSLLPSLPFKLMPSGFPPKMYAFSELFHGGYMLQRSHPP